MARLFFNILPFTTMKMCPKTYRFAKIGSKCCQTLNNPLRVWQRLFTYLSSNLVTLLIFLFMSRCYLCLNIISSYRYHCDLFLAYCFLYLSTCHFILIFCTSVNVSLSLSIVFPNERVLLFRSKFYRKHFLSGPIPGLFLFIFVFSTQLIVNK